MCAGGDDRTGAIYKTRAKVAAVGLYANIFFFALIKHLRANGTSIFNWRRLCELPPLFVAVRCTALSVGATFAAEQQQLRGPIWRV